MKNILFIIISVTCMIIIVHQIRKKALSVKESFWWFIASCIMLVLSIFPNIIDLFAKWLKIDYPPSLLYLLCIIFLIFVNFRASVKIADCQLRIRDLAQELSIVKEKTNEKK